ncbi:MAG: MBL fold metallo-hydrolase [Rhodospirillales bacterium]|nr:MBL fold metallo-hydrolase [Rhodospirillales bacterium]MCW8862641.1 MBL fold metallo-hydrolase [Rhodospirillales bacterium]MCW8951428.1 MBL fold metallo-hydrolase [Rhodospirillales bacterium]MCW9002020.1 MBL fold metallo-hydrolase [Rhodospirillales bacterium]MCW9040309.1 MBL fold metallo-hydrolase [Rhodospirillales bacterium]
MRMTILGCGPSGGIPGVSYGWGACDPKNIKNQRLRPSVFVQGGQTDILVDTSPDLRQQLLNADVRHLDGVLYTHFHADHLNGIDDLRPINRILNGPLDVWADAKTLEVIGRRFGYVFEPLSPGANVVYKPLLTPHEVADSATFTIGDISITPFVQDHGYCDTLGFRFGDHLAYTTDAVDLPDHAFDILAGVRVWVVGVLGREPHHTTHAWVGRALEWIERVKPELAVLTHLGPDLDHQTLLNELPDNVIPAHDGMGLDTEADSLIVA